VKLFASLFLVLVACAGSTERLVPDVQPSVAPPSASSAPAPTATTADLAKRDNTLGFDLWKALAHDHPGNLALSPASIAVAFGMTYAGARGPTADLMRRVLHLDGMDPHKAAGELLAQWNAPGKPYQLRVANQLFGERSMRFTSPFTALLADAYRAALEPVDFSGAPDAVRSHINDWAADHTEQRIKDLLPAGSIDGDTRLVLANAIYFKGQWAQKFEPARTATGTFHASGHDTSAPFMHQHGVFRYGKTDGAQILELPYVGDDLVMTIVLPDGDLPSLERTLDEVTLDQLIASLHGADEVDVTLPRFTLASPSLSLKQAFVALGMGDAFEAGQADFSGMTSDDHLFISDAFHKAVVEVNEEGTVAAAATAVVMTRESMHLVPSFVADRPFMFFVRDLRSNAVLFMGRVVDPT